MAFFNKIAEMFKDEEGNLFDIITQKQKDELYIEALAIAHAVDLIARMVSKTELRVYKYNKEKKKVEEKIEEIYYRLNIKPNPNQTGTAFLYKLTCTLLKEQKVLIILNEINNKKIPYMYVAKSYNTDNTLLRNKTFKNVTIEDMEGNTFTFINKLFNLGNSIYITLENENIMRTLRNFNEKYKQLLKTAYKSYKKSNINKWRLKPPGGQPTMLDPITKKPISYEEYKQMITEGLLTDEESIVMLSEQFDLNLLNENTNKNTSEDFIKLDKGICDKIASAFSIPLDVFYGNKTEKSTGTNDFITMAVEPIFENIEDGLNDGLIGEEDFIKGERIAFYKFVMRHIDIVDSASNLDKLKGIGYSHNDINRMLKLPTIDEPWANEHYITKNYGNVKGGVEGNEG